MPNDAIRKALADMERMESLGRLAKPLSDSIGMSDFIAQRHTLYDQIERDLIQSPTFKGLIDHVSAGDLLSSLSLSADSGLHSSFQDIVEQLQTPLGIEGIYEAVRANHMEGLSEQLSLGIDPTAAIVASSLNFDHLTNPESFARVGVASFTATHALHEFGPFNPKFDNLFEPFFGDWTRYPSLPSDYGDYDSVREEVIEQIDADKALLEISPEEAGSIIEESSISVGGTPLRIFGRSFGLVLVQDPATVAFQLITEFERKLRAKVDRTMKKTFGDNWIADKFPDKQAAWTKRRQEDEDEGLESHSLIQYSDFTELGKVIESHWSIGFASSGIKPRDINKSVNALNPHRRYAMHSRIVRAEQIFGVVQHILRLEAWLQKDESGE